MYLLDTNIVSELRKAEKGRADTHVMRWFERVRTRDTWLSVITLVELRIGMLRLNRRDPLAAQNLSDWFQQKLMVEYAGRILPLDTRAAMLSADFHMPDQSPLNDAYIAAIAKSNHLTVVTRNVRDFEGYGVPVFNPFLSEG